MESTSAIMECASYFHPDEWEAMPIYEKTRLKTTLVLYFTMKDSGFDPPVPKFMTKGKVVVPPKPTSPPTPSPPPIPEPQPETPKKRRKRFTKKKIITPIVKDLHLMLSQLEAYGETPLEPVSYAELAKELKIDFLGFCDKDPTRSIQEFKRMIRIVLAEEQDLKNLDRQLNFPELVQIALDSESAKKPVVENLNSPQPSTSHGPTSQPTINQRVVSVNASLQPAIQRLSSIKKPLDKPLQSAFDQQIPIVKNQSGDSKHNTQVGEGTVNTKDNTLRRADKPLVKTPCKQAVKAAEVTAASTSKQVKPAPAVTAPVTPVKATAQPSDGIATVVKQGTKPWLMVVTSPHPESPGKKRVECGTQARPVIIPRRNPRRQVPVVQYKEAENLNDDDYIFCDECQLEYEGVCPIHGSLTLIEDREVSDGYEGPDHALKTTPSVLAVAQSSITGAGEGVWARVEIDAHMIFGPYVGEEKPPLAQPSGYSWVIRKNNRETFCIDASNSSCSNWMRYVNCSVYRAQQNVIPFQYKKQMFYRTFRVIPAHEELLVWYGNEYAVKLGIDVKAFHSGVPKTSPKAKFLCRFCRIGFVSPLYLNAHMKNCRKKGRDYESEDTDDAETTRSGTLYPCVTCKIGFTSMAFLRRHEKRCVKKTKAKETMRAASNVTARPGSAQMDVAAGTSGQVNAGLVIPEVTESRENNVKELVKSDKQLVKSSGNSNVVRTVLSDRTNKPDASENNNVNDSIEKLTSVGKTTGHVVTVADKQANRDVNSNTFDESNKDNINIVKSAVLNTSGPKVEVNQSSTTQEYNTEIETKMADTVTDYNTQLVIEKSGGQLEKVRKDRSEPGSAVKVNITEEVIESTRPVISTTSEDNAVYDPTQASASSKNKRGVLCKKKTVVIGRATASTKTCKLCGYETAINTSMKNHMRTHTGEQPFQCTECSYKCKRRDSLTRHIKAVHRKEKAFVCTQCEYTSACAGNMKRHMLTHGTVKPFACLLCDYTCIQSSHMNTHKMKHTGEKPHACTLCSYSSAHNSNLKIHMKTHHK